MRLPNRLKPAILVLVAITALAQQGVRVQGRVTDSRGATISGARVTVPELGLSASTDATGNFSLGPIIAELITVRIVAPGFAPLEFVWNRNDAPRDWRLTVSSVEQRVTVTGGARTRTVNVLNRSDLQLTAAPNLDSTLRRIPGFSLFRRTPSWAANPTTQGISLRGVGASGASRGAVVLNGIPLNDPFGGWIYWGRVTPGTVDEANVLQGGASELYGTQAMGGVVELIRNPPSNTQASAETYIGNQFTPGGSVVADTQFGQWAATAAVSTFRTNGYVPVPDDLRGSVDTVVNSENGAGWLELDRNFASGARAFLAGDLYGESRQNGTYLQFNSATIRELRTGFDWSSARAGALSARVYGGTENLRQTFSAVAADRNSETLTRDQSVPASQIGSYALWTKSAWSRHMLMLGVDSGWLQGNSEEWAYTQGTITSRILNGGSQWRTAVFGEDGIRINAHVFVTAGARVDHWVNENARSAALPANLASPPTLTLFPDRSETFFSPRIGIDYAVGSKVVLYASAARAFRGPTLNELYRSFRVGNVLTLANANLHSEHQVGTEAGVTYSVSDWHSIRGTFFWSSIEDPVSNVTLAIAPNLITRQRQNLGSLRSTGVEFAWQACWTRSISTSAAYQYANATVTSFPSDPSLIGLWIPQVPQNNATALLQYVRPSSLTLGLEARYQGLQFDDDRNLFPLGGYFVMNVFVSRDLARNFTMFLAGENLLNRRYEVGRTPVTTIGPPILVRAGVRWIFNAK